MAIDDDRIALACSVRHKTNPDAVGCTRGRDTIHLPEIPNSRVELRVDGEVWSALGARVESERNPIVIEWWLSGGQSVSYALVVYGSSAPIDVDRFFEIDSSRGSEAVFELGAWRFRSDY